MDLRFWSTGGVSLYPKLLLWKYILIASTDGKARKIHYTCDLYFALNWGLITGFSSPFPWFYPVFFACMISHRALRDIQRCRIKYGETWTEYEKQVPYLFIPVSHTREPISRPLNHANNCQLQYVF